MEQEIIHGYKVHPAASMFPNLGKRDLKELVEDIKSNGIKQPIVLTQDGQLLDGRNRLRAWKEAGFAIKDIPTDTFKPDTDKPSELTKAVFALNLVRRHLSDTQRVAIRRKLLAEIEEEESDDETATATGAGKATVKKVKAAQRKNPAKFEKMTRGDTSGRGRPAGKEYPRRVTLSCEGEDKMTPSEAAEFIIEKWHAVPRNYLANFIEQLTSQWESYEPESEEEAEETEDETEAVES